MEQDHSKTAELAAVRSTDGLSGIVLIAEERDRQKKIEGWTFEHDDKHTRKQLALAAESYLVVHTHPDLDARMGAEAEPCWDWPWERKWWKPSNDPIRNLVKAGALIAAEIDRLQRRKLRTKARARYRSKIEALDVWRELE